MTECAICKYLPGHTHVCPQVDDEVWVNTRTGEHFAVTARPSLTITDADGATVAHFDSAEPGES